MNNRGFTLLEMMISMLILTTVTLVLYQVNRTVVRSSLHHEAMSNLRDEGRTALQTMSRMIRNTPSNSVQRDNGQGGFASLDTTPVTRLYISMLTDLDGNGWPVDQNFNLETAPRISFGVDTNDANGDGFKNTQLVQFNSAGNVTRVFTNKLNPNGGVQFVRVAGGVQISLLLSQNGVGLRPPAAVRMNMVVGTRN